MAGGHEAGLPPLHVLSSPSELAKLLDTLFEPTPELHEHLVPAVHQRLSGVPGSYGGIIDICEVVATGWSWEVKAGFIAGHPMIGAPNVGGISGKEQGAGPTTPAVVLRRLSHLNALYCKIYPGLRYITFVNGRTRAEIVTELEALLGLPPSPVPLPDDFPTEQPSLGSSEVEVMVKQPDSEEWRRECDRCLGDIWAIGRARLRPFGVR